MDIAWILIAGLLALVGAAVYWKRQRTEPESLHVRQVSGSRLAVIISDKFANSDRFAGFIHAASGASVVFAELPPATFAQLQDTHNAAPMFEQQGITNVVARDLPHRTGAYVYLTGEQKTNLVDYIKYILVFQEPDLTGMVTVTIPRAGLLADVITEAEIEAIITSAQAIQNVEDVPGLFSLDYLGAFEEDASLVGTSKGYKLKANGVAQTNTVAANGLSPLFLVAPSLTHAPIPDFETFAERSFQGMERMDDQVIDTSDAIQVAELNAIETVGHGTDAKTGEKAFLYQLMIEAPKGGYFRLLGMAADSERERFLSEFKKIGRSFKIGVLA